MIENSQRNYKGQFKKGFTPWLKGKKICCNTGRTHFKKGHPTWNKGIKYPQITGEKNPNWKGGISSAREKFCGTPKYKEWRKSVYKRDRYKCKFCGAGGRTIRAHHIKNFNEYPELRLNVNNGITVCDSCHKIIHYTYKCKWPHAGIGEFVNLEGK